MGHPLRCLLLTLLLSLLSRALPSQAGGEFPIGVDLHNDDVKAGSLRYCLARKLPETAKFIDVVSVRVISSVARVRLFLRAKDDHIASTSAQACTFIRQPSDYLIHTWHQGAPVTLSLKQMGSGQAGFPVHSNQDVLLVEITLQAPMDASATDGGISLADISIHSPSVGLSLTSGFATVSANIAAEDAKAVDHAITACKYMQAATLQPLSVIWSVSEDVSRIELFVMNRETGYRQKLADSKRTAEYGLLSGPMKLHNTNRITTDNYLATKCFFKAADSPVTCTANLLFETSSHTSPTSIYCNHTFLSPAPTDSSVQKSNQVAEAQVVTAEATDNPLVMLPSVVKSKIVVSKATDNPPLTLASETKPKAAVSEAAVEAESQVVDDLSKAMADSGTIHYEEVAWLQSSNGNLRLQGSKIGAIAGVSMDTQQDRVAVVHTGRKTKHKSLFNADNLYRYIQDGPILDDAVLEIDPSSGAVVGSWGSKFFVLPHGIHVDHLGRYWITDRARHQVFGFHRGQRKPFLTLGEKYVPGYDDDHFCKPSGVVVSESSGTVFIADGHCNSRIMKFSASGHLLANWLLDEDRSAVFHSIALSPVDDTVCVAVSTSSQIFCVDRFSGTLMKTFQSSKVPVPLEGIAFGGLHPANGHPLLHAVGGGTHGTPVSGVTLDYTANTKIDSWVPDSHTKDLTLVHALAATKDGADLYVADLAPGKLLKFSRQGRLDSSAAFKIETSQTKSPSTSPTTRKSTTGAKLSTPVTKVVNKIRIPVSKTKTAAATSERTQKTLSKTASAVHITPTSQPHVQESKIQTVHAREPGATVRVTTGVLHSATNGLVLISGSSVAPVSNSSQNSQLPLVWTEHIELEAGGTTGTTGTPNTTGHYRPLNGAETIAISIIGSCIGIIIFAIIARLYISCQKRRKFHRRLFPEEYGDKSTRRVLLENEKGGFGHGDDEEDWADESEEGGTYGDKRAFRYYWKKVAKQVT